MQERVICFTLFGQEFSFYSDASDDEVQGAVALLRDTLEGTELAAKSTIPSSKMLVLGCLQLAASYVKLDNEFNAFRTVQEQKIDKLITKVVSSMD